MSSDKNSSKNDTTAIKILPASFWEANGFTEKEAKGMEIVQQKLISGSSTIHRYPDGSMALRYGSDGKALRYHESALPYWQAFANVPGLLDNFSVKNIKLPQVVWQTITPKINNIKQLSFSNNELEAEGFFGLAQFLSGNTTLEVLSFEDVGNDLTDLQAAKALSLAMKGHPSLCKVNAVYMEIGGLYHLDNPTPDIAKAFIDGCENCVELHLNRVGMGDTCAEAYGDMLKRNKKLRTLCIFWEYFSSTGVEAITKGVYDTTSLNSIADSNHKCVIYISESVDDPNYDVATKMIFVNGMDCSDSLKIRYKVQRALFGVGREPQVDAISDTRRIVPEDGKELDLSYFGDLPLELAPRLLEFMLKQRMVMDHEYATDGYYIKRSWFVYYDEKKREYLNRIFQAFRGWVVPLLFGDVNTQRTKRKRVTK